MTEIHDLRLTHFCTGCGLCQSLKIAELNIDEKGFSFPYVGNEEQLKTLCPAVSKNIGALDGSKIWGKNEAVYIGWSNKAEVRTKASSGGVLSEILIFLLEKGLVNEVIHCTADPNVPTKVDVFFSKTSEEILQRSGSRYAISHPLIKINQIDTAKKYAFVGRPCDVAVLRNYLKTNTAVSDAIPYLFSFFCMGTPSALAQSELLDALSCPDCKELTYRGQGWPGFTVAKDSDGKTYQMTYGESWGKILGRDLMPLCKFCIDGIGEEADISCGDAWYQLENGSPDFSEHDGRNIVFARNSKGVKLLQSMMASGCVTLQEIPDYTSYLNKIQKSQRERKAFLGDRILALKVSNRPYPNYTAKILRSYSKGIPVPQHFKAFLGTLKRSLRNRV